MRRILTQSDIDKKKRRTQWILGIVLVGLLLFSTLGYSLSSKSDSSSNVKIGGNKFEKNGEYWVVNLDNQQFAFRHLPTELENVSVSGIYDLNTYSGKPLYFVNVDSESKQEILNNLGRYVQRYQEACLEGRGAECGEELPVKTCVDNLIIFKTSNSTSVAREDNCIYISGDSLRGIDAFLYRVLGISQS